jgi:hypothetical protein
MSFDGQVLMIAHFAVALKLFLWSRERHVVVVEVEPDRKDRLHIDDSGLQPPAEARAEDIFTTALSPRLKGDRNV